MNSKTYTNVMSPTEMGSSINASNINNNKVYTINSAPEKFLDFQKQFTKATNISDTSDLIFFFTNNNNMMLCFFDDKTYSINVPKNKKLEYSYKLRSNLVPNIPLRSHHIDNLHIEDIDDIKKKQEELIEEYTQDILQKQIEQEQFLKEQRKLFVKKRNEIVSKNSHLANYFEREFYRRCQEELGIELNIPTETPQEGKELEECSNCELSKRTRLYQCKTCSNYYLCEKCIDKIESHGHHFILLRNKIVEEVIQKIVEKPYEAEVIDKDRLLRLKYKSKQTQYDELEIKLKNKGTKDWTSRQVEIKYIEGDLSGKGIITLPSLITKQNGITSFRINLNIFKEHFSTPGVYTINLQCYSTKNKAYFDEAIHLKVMIE